MTTDVCIGICWQQNKKPHKMSKAPDVPTVLSKRPECYLAACIPNIDKRLANYVH